MKYTLDLETSQALIGDHSPLNEATEADKYGIRVYAHPLGALLPPTLKELRDAVALVKSKTDNVYAHCEHGVDRTGMVCAAWRILEQGWTPWSAAKEALAMGMHWYAYGFWLIQLWRLK
jgi:protein-tyrosine phosphatase